MLFADFPIANRCKIWHIHYTKLQLERTVHRSMMCKSEVLAITAVIYARYSSDNQREEIH